MTATIANDPLPEHSYSHRLKKLGLYGLAERVREFEQEPWMPLLLETEEAERGRRSLARRLHNARIGDFKSIQDFDWHWPKHIDRPLVDDLFRLSFLQEAANAVLIGPNGVGKTTLAQNLAHEAVLQGHTVRFTSASELLNTLAAEDSPSGLQRRLQRYAYPSLLVIDEVGYLSYHARHADLLFQVLNQRHRKKSTVITTNKPFSEWNEVFPHSSSVVAMIDRLTHKAEIVQIEGNSYRLKEAKERAESRKKEREEQSKRKSKKNNPRRNGS